MKKLFSLIFASLLIFSCSTEEDEEIINPGTDYNVFLNGNLEYDEDADGIYIQIPLVATANPDPTNLSVRFSQNGQQVGSSFNTLLGGNGNYQLANNRWNINPSTVDDGIVTAELYSIESGTTSWRATGISTTFTVQWPDDIGPGDPEPDTATVRFTSIERIDVPGSDPYYRLGYTDCSNTDGFVTIELWKGGVYQNVTMDRALIQSSGFIETDVLDNLIVGSDYQLRIINQSGQDPAFKFLDINDNEMNSHIYNFTAEANAAMVNVSSLVTNNITSTSFNADLQYSIDTTDPQTLSVKLFESTDLNNPISGQEQNQQTTGSGTEIFSTMFNGLNPNIEYTFRYYLNGIQIFEGVVTTANGGSYSTEIENLSTTVNSVTGTFEYDNTTGNDIIATLEFSGIGINGNPLVITENVTFTNGNTNTDIVRTKNGFMQNSNVAVSIIVNGVVVETQNTTTMILNITSYQMNPGVAMVPNPNHPNPSPAMMAGYVGMTGNGNATTGTFNLKIVSTTGLNPNSYISYVRINSGQEIAANWVEDTANSGTWNMSISQTEDISNSGINGYNIYFGTQNYVVVDVSGVDNFDLFMSITDNSGFTHGDNSNNITIPFGL